MGGGTTLRTIGAAAWRARFPARNGAEREKVMDDSQKGLIKIQNKSREQKATSELSRPCRRSAPSAWRRTGGWLLPVLAAAIIFAPPFVPTVEAQTVQVSNVGQTRSEALSS